MSTMTCRSSSSLKAPVPDACSDLYAAGWAFADMLIEKSGDLNAPAPTNWNEDKARGFLARLSLAREDEAEIIAE